MDEIKNELEFPFSQDEELHKLRQSVEESSQQDSRSLVDKAKDYVGVVATLDAVNDDNLRGKVSNLKQEELKLRAEADVKSEMVNSKKKDKDLQEAEFGTYAGSAAYAGIKKPLPRGMQKVLFPILCLIQSIFLIVIGTVTSVITIIGDCVNAVVERINTFTMTARRTIVALLIGGFLYIAYIVLQQILANYGIII